VYIYLTLTGFLLVRGGPLPTAQAALPPGYETLLDTQNIRLLPGNIASSNTSVADPSHFCQDPIPTPPEQDPAPNPVQVLQFPDLTKKVWIQPDPDPQ
jgi:hypothetical protein